MTDDFSQLGEEGADAPVPSGGSAEMPNAPVAAGGGETIRYSAPQVKAARMMLTRLSALRRAARFYPMDHPAVADAVARFGRLRARLP